MSKIKFSPSIVINHDASVINAIKQLEKCKEVGSLIVVDNKKDLKVVGVLSDGDIRRFIIEKKKLDFYKTRVKEIIEKKPLEVTTVSTSDSWFYKIGKARGDNQDLRIRIVPIVENERLVGVLDLVATKDRSRLDAILMEIAYPTIKEKKEKNWLTVDSIKKRRENYDTYHFESQVKKYEALAKLDKGEILAVIQKNRVDLLYRAFKRGSDWVKNFPHPNKEFKERMKGLAIELDRATISLLMLYLPVKFLETKRSGVAIACESETANKTDLKEEDVQHIVCVLGCSGESELSTRIEETFRILRQLNEEKKNFPVIIVLSGGGRDGKRTEASIMKDLIIKEISKDTNKKLPVKKMLKKGILLEEDSLDTVGNAVFSTFVLLREKVINFNYKERRFEGSNNKKIKIWVVTSDYHAPRALNLFTRIFRSNQVQVCLAPTVADIQTYVKRAEKQFDSEHMANSQTFALEDVITGLSHDIAVGEVFSIFFQLLKKHDLYKNREDFLRDYQEIIGQWLVSQKDDILSSNGEGDS